MAELSISERYTEFRNTVNNVITIRDKLASLWDDIKNEIFTSDRKNLISLLFDFFTTEIGYFDQLKKIRVIDTTFDNIKKNDLQKQLHLNILNEITESIKLYYTYFTKYKGTDEYKLNYHIDIAYYSKNIEQRKSFKLDEFTDYTNEIDHFIIIIVLYDEIYKGKDNLFFSLDSVSNVIKDIDIGKFLNYHDNLLSVSDSKISNYYTVKYKKIINSVIPKIKQYNNNNINIKKGESGNSGKPVDTPIEKVTLPVDKGPSKDKNKDDEEIIQKYSRFRDYVKNIVYYLKDYRSYWTSIINFNYNFSINQEGNDSEFLKLLIASLDEDNKYHKAIYNRNINDEYDELKKSIEKIDNDNKERVNEITNEIDKQIKYITVLPYEAPKIKLEELVKRIKSTDNISKVISIYSILTILYLSSKIVNEDKYKIYQNQLKSMITTIRDKSDDIIQIHNLHTIDISISEKESTFIHSYKKIINYRIQTLLPKKNTTPTETPKATTTPIKETQKTETTTKTNPVSTTKASPVPTTKTNPISTPKTSTTTPETTKQPSSLVTKEQQSYMDKLDMYNKDQYIEEYKEYIIEIAKERESYIKMIRSFEVNIKNSFNNYLNAPYTTIDFSRTNLLDSESGVLNAEYELSQYYDIVNKEVIWENSFITTFNIKPATVPEYIKLKTNFDNIILSIKAFIKEHGHRGEYIKICDTIASINILKSQTTEYLEGICDNMLHMLLLYIYYKSLLESIKLSKNVSYVIHIRSTLRTFFDHIEIWSWPEKFEKIITELEKRKLTDNHMAILYHKRDLFTDEYSKFFNTYPMSPKESLKLEEEIKKEAIKKPHVKETPIKEIPVKENPIEIDQEDNIYVLDDGTSFREVKEDYNKILAGGDKNALEDFKKTNKYKEYYNTISNNIKTKILSLYSYKRHLNNPVYVGVINSDDYYQPSKQKCHVQKIKDHHYLSVDLRNNITTEIKVQNKRKIITFEETNKDIQFRYNDQMKIMIMIIFENDYNPNTGHELGGTNNGNKIYYRIIPLNIHKNTGNIIEYERIDGGDLIILKKIIIEIDDYYRTVPNPLIKKPIVTKSSSSSSSSPSSSSSSSESSSSSNKKPKVLKPEVPEITETTESGSETETATGSSSDTDTESEAKPKSTEIKKETSKKKEQEVPKLKETEIPKSTETTKVTEVKPKEETKEPDIPKSTVTTTKETEIKSKEEPEIIQPTKTTQETEVPIVTTQETEVPKDITTQGKYNINELDIGYLNITNDNDEEDKYKKLRDIGKKFLNKNTKGLPAWDKWSTDTSGSGDDDSDSIGYFT